MSGTHILSLVPTLYTGKRVRVANSLVDIRPTELFRIMVANFADEDVTLANNEVLALALPAPSKVFTVSVDPRERVRRMQRLG